MGLMRAIVQRLRLLRSRQIEEVRLKLARAGWRSNDALTLFLFGKLTLPFVFGGLAILIVRGLHAWDLSGPNQAMLIVLAALIGSYFPELLVKKDRKSTRLNSSH